MEKISYEGYAAERLKGSQGEMGSWPLVSKYLEGKRALDIGCSNGLYLKYMGEDSKGIEQIPELVESARTKGLDVEQNDVMGGLAAIADSSFEAVLFSHVMEHLENPIASLREINRVLEKEGVLVLGLPIEKCLMRQILGHDYYDGTHLYNFTIRNSERLLELTGFQIVAKYYHLPKFRSALGRRIQKLWNVIPFPFKEYFSMGYWIAAKKI